MKINIFRWENEENGEFRITDSSLFSKLWAFVKGNKKMNYEKLSRGMRYVEFDLIKFLMIVPKQVMNVCMGGTRI